ADRLRRLAIRLFRRVPRLVHRVEHAPVHGLEPVSDVGQRPPDDHAHRVIQVGLPHLVFNVDGDLLVRCFHHSPIAPSPMVALPSTQRAGRCAYTSRLVTSSAFCSMNSRRGSPSSPISTEKIVSAATASSIRTCRSLRTFGSIVVSQSCSGFISPSPL